MRIFITGISSGIGRALARQAIAAGHEVWGIARRAELLDELKREFTAPQFITSQCDVDDVAAMRAVAAAMREAGWVPDAVILNAGVYLADDGEGFHFDAHRRTFGVNVDGALFWVTEWLPDFLRRRAGVFVAISSTAALRPSESAYYSASKAALSMAFRQLRVSFAGRGVTFSTMHFGPIDTDMWRGRRTALVASAADAAAAALRLLERPAGSYFFPFVSTWLLRLSSLVPDRVFLFVSRLVLKRVRE